MTLPFVLRVSAKACGEGMVQAQLAAFGGARRAAFISAWAGQGLLYGASGTRIPNLHHALATSAHKPEKEFYTRRVHASMWKNVRSQAYA